MYQSLLFETFLSVNLEQRNVFETTLPFAKSAADSVA